MHTNGTDFFQDLTNADVADEELLPIDQTPELKAWEPSAAAFGEEYAQVSAAKAFQRPTGKAAKDAKRKAAQRKADDERRSDVRKAQDQNACSHDDHAPAPVAHTAPKKRTHKSATIAAGVVAVCLAAAGAGFGYHWYCTHPVSISLDDQVLTVEGSQRSVQGLLEDGVIELSAGDYLAIDGSVLKKQGGQEDQLRLNGVDLPTSAYDQLLKEGDALEIRRGKDVTEDYSVQSKVRIPHTVTVTGQGAIHWYAQGNGRDGSKGVTTGKESGLVVNDVIRKPQNVKVVQYSANTRGRKVIALTFDDGPWPTTTEAILDVLKKNKAKATFFTLGNQIEGREHMIKRMHEEGHQICTHSFDHAAGSGQGVNITYMSRKEQRQEIVRGMEAISSVTGEEASTVVRLPGGNVNERTMDILSDLVSAEINWDVDTRDWSRPGTKAIYRSIMSAREGSIVLLHDGGGDRTQTVRALRKALPALRKKGYEFVTVDQLIADYPAS